MERSNRLDFCLDSLKKKSKKAFVSFTTAGFPDLETFPQILEGLSSSGVDMIEIGMPFSDPVADGPVIQEANLQAFKAGITVPKILEFVRQFRTHDKNTPIILMGYYNPIYSYGLIRFLDEAQESGVDAFIVPDLPPEEDEEFRLPAKKRNMHMIRLVTPTSDEARLSVILDGAKGFLYYVSVTGITGGKTAKTETLREAFAKIRPLTNLPLAIGFGVSTPEQAHEMAQLADGVIVGSAITNKIKENLDDDGKATKHTVSKTLGFIKSLARAVHS
ncbi:MAG TPA: tryptophan synthase subunit alpha [Rhodospirillaceae bacterium]|nr:tryptophan synthase subunit alpha [Rhodospirillaceae bacterium]